MINEISTYTEYKDDLAEAIICYNEGHYKASLMIIFSIISNILLLLKFLQLIILSTLVKIASLRGIFFLLQYSTK